MTPVEQYIFKQSESTSDILDFLNVYIMSFDPMMKVAMKWSVPYYSRKKSICYLRVLQDNSIELNFTKGKAFKDQTKALLFFGKRTAIGGVQFTNLEDIDEDLLKLLMEEAIRIDEL